MGPGRALTVSLSYFGNPAPAVTPGVDRGMLTAPGPGQNSVAMDTEGRVLHSHLALPAQGWKHCQNRPAPPAGLTSPPHTLKSVSPCSVSPPVSSRDSSQPAPFSLDSVFRAHLSLKKTVWSALYTLLAFFFCLHRCLTSLNDAEITRVLHSGQEHPGDPVKFQLSPQPKARARGPLQPVQAALLRAAMKPAR